LPGRLRNARNGFDITPFVERVERAFDAWLEKQEGAA